MPNCDQSCRPDPQHLASHWKRRGQTEASETLGAQELKSMLYGLVIILFLRFQPRGLVGAWHDLRRMWVNWPLRY